MPPNYTIRDIAMALAGIPVMGLVLLVPGWGIGWAANILGFRARGVVARVALAIVISVCVCPIATYLVARFAGSVYVWAFLGLCWALAAWSIITGPTGRDAGATRGPGDPPPPRRRSLWVPVALALVWLAIVLFTVCDWDDGRHLYFSVVSYDYTKHIAVTDAITRCGVPPENPFFRPEKPIPLCYYYFWFLMTSLGDRLGGSVVTPRGAVFAGTWWCGLGLLAVVSLYLTHRLAARPARARATAIVGAALLLVTGLDVLCVWGPAAHFLRTGTGTFRTDMEGWNEQVTAWLGQVLWVPQHVAGLTACVMGLLVLRRSLEGSVGSRVRAGLFLGICLASAAGLSVYVTLVVVLALCGWVAAEAVQRNTRILAPAAAAGAVGLVLVLPFLRELSDANLLGGIGMEVAVRRFFPLDAFFAEVGAGTTAQNVVLLGVLPWNYLIELGFFGVAGVVYLVVRRPLAADADQRCELALLVASVLIATFVRSNIRNNDLGWRGFMPAQFVLLVWSVDVLSWLWAPVHRWTGSREPPVRLRGWVRAALVACLALGLLSTTYDLVFLRVSYPLIDSYRVGANGENGLRHRDARAAYEWVDRTLPHDAVVQHNPLRPIDSYRGLYGNRQVVASDRLYGTMFGVPEEFYGPYLELVGAMFRQSDWEAVQPDAASLGIDYLLVKSVDPCWGDPGSWVWQRAPAYANPHVRVFAVSPSAERALR